MSQSIGLNLGESFTEVSGAAGVSSFFSRHYTPNMNLTKPLQELESNCADKELNIFITTDFARTIYRKKLGDSPAFLVTQGFESWLEMNLPIDAQTPFHTKRVEAPMSSDMTFGLGERIGADGKVEVPLDINELEFICSKLKLHNCQHVGVGLLHSNQNDCHLVACKEVLEKHDLEVFLAPVNLSESQMDNERHAWLTAILNAYAHKQFHELKDEIENKILQKLPKAKVEFVSSHGLLRDHPRNVLQTQFAAQSLLFKHLKAKNIQTPFALYLGIENFYLISLQAPNLSQWMSPWGTTLVERPPVKRLSLQPTQAIREGFWGSAQLIGEEIGYEPGPICLGRSTQLALMDVMALQRWLDRVDGLSSLFNERSFSRIEESLRSLCRQRMMNEDINVTTVSQELSDLAIQNWATELHQLTGGQEILCCGPLAKDMYMPLKLKVPFLSLASFENQSYAQSLSLLEAVND